MLSRPSWLILIAAVLWGCEPLPMTRPEDSGQPIAAAVDGGHHPEDAGADAGEDAGHLHQDAGEEDAGQLPRDAGEEDAGHLHQDAGADAGTIDAGHVHDAGVPAMTSVRFNGQCFELCTTNSDPDGDGWGFQNGTSCVMPNSPNGMNSPWCETPVPQTPYAPTPATVTATTQTVAVLPRPVRVTVPPPSACPHLRTDLVPFDQNWLAADGTVSIPNGTRVLINGNVDLPATTLITTFLIPPQAEVVLADRDTTLRVRDFTVQGAFRVGSPTCRVSSHIEFIFDTDEPVADAGTRQAIYARTGLGLVVENGGSIDLFGKLYQPTWTRLAQTAAAGATTLQLQEAVDWEPGQQLVVTPSTTYDYPYGNPNEVRTISAVNGTSVTITQPLFSLHYGGAEYQVEVGLLTRNIVLKTSATVLAAAPTFGGHLMVHGGLTRISGVELVGMGQQNFKGRYPMHFHHGGDLANNSYFTDSSIRQSNWRCAVIHRSSRALVSRNVAYDNFGHCFYLEDGVELDNELSFNLAARTKIMGPTDTASLAELNAYDQAGFTQLETSEYANPADRAAAGFYISNGNNRIIGNAASGAFFGFALPNLPRAIGGSLERIVPLHYSASHFDGNSAHTAGYLWFNAGCVYAGGLLTEVEVNGQTKLRYQSGRPNSWLLERQRQDVFSNTKTFLCPVGIAHWGRFSRVINLEAADTTFMARLFGAASIEGAVFRGATNNTVPVYTPKRGFQFYDTWTQTILRDVVFRNIHSSTTMGMLPTDDNCALLSMSHSDQYTPQRMNTTARLFFDDVDESQRWCHDDSGTLASRNFNLIDSDGTATGRAGDGLPAGPRLIGSGFTDIWRTSSQCVKHPVWGLWLCPLIGAQNVASIAVTPSRGVSAALYDFTGANRGVNRYSTTAELSGAQLTGPSHLGWHHSFPGGVPATFPVYAMQVPQGSFVVLSFWLPTGVSCSVTPSTWQPVANLQALLNATGPVYTTERNACFIRVPPVENGVFSAAGMSVPVQAWSGMSELSNFTVVTGCTSGNAACQGTVPATLPSMVGITPPP